MASPSAPAQDDCSAIPVTTLERLYGVLAQGAFVVALLAAKLRGASASELNSRTGLMPEGKEPLLWFHGASAGEMAAAISLVEVLRNRGFHFTAGYTVTNEAGLEYLANAGGSRQIAALAPFDVSSWIGRALDYWRPAALFLIETELWPGLILETYRRGVPIFSVSSRIYRRDVPRYRLVKSLMRPALRRLTAILAQNEVERQRFIALGACPKRCVSAGNLKYLRTGDIERRQEDLRARLGLRAEDRPLVFGSVHDDEVPTIFQACDLLKDVKVRLIIAPRHRSAVAPIIRQSMVRGWRIYRRSEGVQGDDWRVLVLDTMGELRDCYSLAGVAVVGGGFQKHGGHNPLEPVIQGAPVMFGPYLDHFEFEAQALVAAAEESRVFDSTQLGQRLNEWISDEARRSKILDLQRSVLPDGEAIAERYLRELSPWLEDRCA